MGGAVENFPPRGKSKILPAREILQLDFFFILSFEFPYFRAFDTYQEIRIIFVLHSLRRKIQ